MTTNEIMKSRLKYNRPSLRARARPPKTWINRKTPVLLVVGSDCDSGKMTTAWEIKKRLQAENKNVEFIGTGQTGILLSGGIAVDAVVADFMAGEIEYLIDKNIKDDTDLVTIVPFYGRHVTSVPG